MDPLPDSMKCGITTQRDINAFFKIDDKTANLIRSDAAASKIVASIDPVYDNRKLDEFMFLNPRACSPDAEYYRLKNSNGLVDAPFTLLLPLMARISPRARAELFGILGYERVQTLSSMVPGFAFTKISRKAFKRPVPVRSNLSEADYGDVCMKSKREIQKEYERAKLFAARADAPVIEMLRREMRTFTRKYIA